MWFFTWQRNYPVYDARAKLFKASTPLWNMCQFLKAQNLVRDLWIHCQNHLHRDIFFIKWKIKAIKGEKTNQEHILIKENKVIH